MNIKYQQLLLSALAVIVFASVSLAGDIGSSRLNKADFESVPMEYRPWTYYWWLKGNVTPEQITYDLEQMREKGFGGVLLFDSRGYHEDPKRHIPVPLEIENEFMGPRWRKLVVHLIQEAKRLNLQVSMNLSNTGGHLRGPWDFKEEGPREIIWTEENVNGPKTFTTELTDFRSSSHVNEKAPYYRDIALIAVRLRLPVESGREEGKLNESWGVVQNVLPKNPVVEETVNLTPLINHNKITWTVPKGAWRILRFGNRVIGDYGSIDILNKDIVARYYHKIGTQMLRQAGDAGQGTLTHFYNVSWEGSNPNWTDGFECFFKQQRGYDLFRYLPVLRGLVVGSPEESRRFMVDFNRTISDAFCLNCYQQIGNLCRAQGVKWHSEDGGPWERTAPMFKEADMLSFWGQNDMPQGEFWVYEKEWGKTRSNMKYAAMAGHIYGLNKISVEAFTHMAAHYAMYPAQLKPAADVNFIDGTNMFIWHTFTASPPSVGKPGFEYFAGTHINTNVTWWNKAEGILSYLGRCQYLLRQGLYAADICVYTSDKNCVSWGRGETWNSSSNLKPVQGFAYDLLDTNVLLNRMKFEDGYFTLPDGMKYRILVLDPIESELPLAALEKIKQMVLQGGIVVVGKNRPTQVRGLTGYPDADTKLEVLVKELWGDGSKRMRTLGKGKVCSGALMQEVLARECGVPDFQGPFEYLHRRTAQDDIYFVSGSGRADCSFRVAGRRPELWNPLTGKTTPAESWFLTPDGRTTVTLNLPAYGSVFVVFSEPLNEYHFTKANVPKNGLEITGQIKDQIQATLWRSGTYEFVGSKGNKIVKTEAVPSVVELSGPWKVAFDPAWGGPQETVFDKLVYWNDHSDPGIKFYSGTAVYRKKFNLTLQQTKQPLRLSLGEVNRLATLRLTGHDLGVVWTAPWLVSLDRACRTGENLPEIEVTNCWVNRLIGDALLPPEKRLTKTNLHLYKKTEQYRAFQGYSEAEPLRPSGLIGPVKLEFGKKIVLSTK
ncbi:MAG: glycosyl hydrolase [Thermoguttaceae bacterium]|nr:glycosyl hydrolase [Thermoguttaceae bacterium]